VRTASPPLAEFSERISGIASLGPLTFEESCSYIRQKIELSGFRDDQRFTNDAIVLIAKLTGIPGDINNICFEAVYRAEQRGYRRIDEGLVWRSRPKKAAPVHRLTRKKSHQPRPGFRFSAQRRRLLDLPGQDAGRSSNDCNRAMAHNLFCIRRQSAVGRGTPCQLALATGSGTSAWHGPGLRGNSHFPAATRS